MGLLTANIFIWRRFMELQLKLINSLHLIKEDALTPVTSMNIVSLLFDWTKVIDLDTRYVYCLNMLARINVYD